MHTAEATPYQNYNNITGTGWTGVYLSAGSDNNTITFNHNNITGDGGVSLSASSSNNTITFNHNNITGNWAGVYLGAYSRSNTIPKLQQHHRMGWC